MYLSYTDFENNKDFLENKLRLIVNDPIKDTYVYIRNYYNKVILNIYISRRVTQFSTNDISSYQVKLDATTGAFTDSGKNWAPINILHIISLWPKHMKEIKKRRFNLIKKELLSRFYTSYQEPCMP